MSCLFVCNVIYLYQYLNMIFKLITGVIFVLIIERTLVLGNDEITSNEIDTDDDNKPGKPTSNADTTLSDTDQSNEVPNSLEDVTQNTTSQDRITYHTKRGAPKYYTTIRRPKLVYSHRSRPSYSKSRRKYRRSRRKPFSYSPPSIISAGPPPSIISAGPPIISAGSPIISSDLPSGPPAIITGGPPIVSKSKYQSLFKQKPIFLSELLRSSSFSKFKPNNSLAPRPVHEFVNEGELADPNSFPPIDTVDSFPSTVNHFDRPPPSFEVTGPDSSPPLNTIGQEAIYPGVVRPTLKRPGVNGGEMYSNNPSDIYLEDDTMNSIRNVRLANDPAPNNYVDREILNLLQKMKQDGVSLESRPEITTSRNSVKETSAAITKLLTPFLSESSIKKIRSYLNLGLSGTNKKEKESEKNVNNIVIVENPKSGDDKSISVTESSKDDEGNAQYFIMLKQKNNKTATVDVQSLKNKGKSGKGGQTSTSSPETKTPVSLQSLELQHYIMSLAGLGEPQVRDYKSNDYLPRFSAFQDATDKENKPYSVQLV